MSEKSFESFGITDADGRLTNAGALLADKSPVRCSRLFCTRWNGLDKSGGQVDALDSAEYSGSLIVLLKLQKIKPSKIKLQKENNFFRREKC
ncbi:hypothetical protein NE619_06655 [Anaerovorax odorimutans]|uniref:Uncharacterized protein n=1 Tax=Anaerovorax odorimutans TaxID=109327 RepID=A0ABT1RMK0_9FIRM|nr:hypothetical protein [Anaerovorax odorimutans]